MHKAKSTTEDQLAQFFKYVGYGKQEEAEATLKSNPKLATAYGDLTDCSVEPKTHAPRTWKNITAFQSHVGNDTKIYEYRKYEPTNSGNNR